MAKHREVKLQQALDEFNSALRKLEEIQREGALITSFMFVGDSLNIRFPSGKEINLEVTQDTASVTTGDTVLYSEVLNHGKWLRDWPKEI